MNFEQDYTVTAQKSRQKYLQSQLNPNLSRHKMINPQYFRMNDAKNKSQCGQYKPLCNNRFDNVDDARKSAYGQAAQLYARKRNAPPNYMRDRTREDMSHGRSTLKTNKILEGWERKSSRGAHLQLRDDRAHGLGAFSVTTGQDDDQFNYRLNEMNQEKKNHEEKNWDYGEVMYNDFIWGSKYNQDYNYKAYYDTHTRYHMSGRESYTGKVASDVPHNANIDLHGIGTANGAMNDEGFVTSESDRMKYGSRIGNFQHIQPRGRLANPQGNVNYASAAHWYDVKNSDVRRLRGYLHKRNYDRDRDEELQAVELVQQGTHSPYKGIRPLTTKERLKRDTGLSFGCQ